MKLALAAGALVCALFCASPAPAAELDLETLDGPTAVKLMDEGKLTSVELTRAYIARIAALNKRGPGLNAVTQLNAEALKDAALLDKERRDGHVRGPAHGLPVLLKDLIDVKGMYTSAGNFSLRNSFPAIDSGVAKKLRENGVVILGKLGLSEYANFFGNQPSGFSQPDRPGAQRARRRPEPERLVVGLRHGRRRRAVDADRRHRDVGLDHQPVAGQRPRRPAADGRARARLRHRADLGLAGHGRPDGPHGRQRGADAAVDRRLRPAQRRATTAASGARASTDTDIIPPVPATVPNYMSALDLELRARQADRLERHRAPSSTQAKAALAAAGAILVERPVINPGTLPGWRRRLTRQHIATSTSTTGTSAPDAPIKSLAEEVADNQANEHEALKFGNGTHARALAIDIGPGSASTIAYRTNLLIRQADRAGPASTG